MSGARRSVLVLVGAICVLILPAGLRAATFQEEPPPRREFQVREATSAIQVDGVLDEPAWDDAVAIDLPYEWRPGDNVPPPVETRCLITYDADNLYVAFRANDPRPGEIRAHVWDRDEIRKIANDDHVGFIVDTFNDQRRGYQFRVNALGVQAEAVMSEIDQDEDWSWDAIWESRGRLVDDGYVVELAIPFTQLRFHPSSEPQTWGFVASRSYPRSDRHRIRSEYLDRDNSCILCQANRLHGFEGITPGHDLELNPTLTSRRTDRRRDFPTGDFESDAAEVDAGLTASWGITPGVGLDATLNPDFSQVEADVAQLEVNTRFALFFPEKRPFFLEGINYFDTPLEAVFTRTVADPTTGVKLTGKTGPNSFGLFVARDRVNNLSFPSNQETGFDQIDQGVTSGVARYRRDVGENSALGLLYTGREARGYHNRVGGVDGYFRLSDRDTVTFQFLHSDTAYPTSVARRNHQPEGSFGGDALLVSYEHSGRDWRWGGEYRDLGRDFRADSGFIPRVDFREVEAGIGRVFWGDEGDWYRQVSIDGEVSRAWDDDGLLTDEEIEMSAHYQGPWQSFGFASLQRERQRFAGRIFELFGPRFFGQIRPWGDLQLELYARFGDEIDVANVRKADTVVLHPELQASLGRNLSLDLSHIYQRLSDDGAEIFTANLTEARVRYHFNLRALLSAIVQYRRVARNPEQHVEPAEPRTERLFTQLLFSYKLNARTVLFLGYSGNGRGTSGYDLTRSDRTLFLKLGYAWLF